MKNKIDPVDLIIAAFITAFMFLCMVVVKNNEVAAAQIEYDPPCSLEYQLTVLEQRRCEAYKDQF